MYKRMILCLPFLLLLSCLPVQAEELSLSSASAVVMEADSGKVLFEKDAHTARPMASTTKLMTALVAAEALPLNKELTASGAAVAVEGSALGLRAGDAISMEDLLTGLLLASGNDAANVVAESVAGSLTAFASLMNAKAAALGMQNSGFVTPSGLDADGHHASAYDMALLGRAVLQNDFLREVCAQSRAQISFGQPKRTVWVKNHNRLLEMSKDCIGMKTGYTKKAGRCLVSAAQRDGITIVVVTLHGSDDWNDHLKLYEYAFSRVVSVQPTTPKLQPLAVAGGMSDAVGISTEQPPAMVLPTDHSGVVTTMELPPFLWAPIQSGDTVGYVTYRYGNAQTVVLPIVANDNVDIRPLSSFGQRLWKCYQRILKVFFK